MNKQLRIAKDVEQKPMSPLGEFEQIVLTAVVLLGEGAYGAKVHEKVEALAEGRIKVPAVYVTLDRMEDKDYVTSKLTDPKSEPDHRSRRYFSLTERGDLALQQATATARRMVAALSEIDEPWSIKKWRKHRAKT